MDLTTQYLGLKLKNPLVASASPISEKLSSYRKLEDAGCAAVVNYSLFEEEITRDTHELHQRMTQGTESFAESLTYFPEPDYFTLGPEQYLEHIQKAKQAVDIPVIASLNGHSLGGWTKYAQLMEQAGADAIELNIYFIPTDPHVDSETIEMRYLEILKSVLASVQIPVSVKLSPFITSIASLTRRLEASGASGLVLFNRFYQPDIDLERLEVVPNVVLSTPDAARLPLRWIAILRDRLQCSLAATSGVHAVEDVVKLVMAGADVTMLCSALLKFGVLHVNTILKDLESWMEAREYESIRQMKGSMSQRSCQDPSAFERAHYIKALRTYHLM